MAARQRWYVRDLFATHEYDDRVAVPAGRAWCRTCVAVHARPVSGADWHVESNAVDRMLCGVVVDLDEGEVRMRPAKNICQECLAIAEETRS